MTKKILRFAVLPLRMTWGVWGGDMTLSCLAQHDNGGGALAQYDINITIVLYYILLYTLCGGVGKKELRKKVKKCEKCVKFV